MSTWYELFSSELSSPDVNFQLDYDGGTSFSSLPVTGKHPVYLLFSDGFVTLSDGAETTKELLAPVYPISSSPEANHNLLKIWGMFRFSHIGIWLPPDGVSMQLK